MLFPHPLADVGHRRTRCGAGHYPTHLHCDRHDRDGRERLVGLMRGNHGEPRHRKARRIIGRMRDFKYITKNTLHREVVCFLCVSYLLTIS